MRHLLCALLVAGLAIAAPAQAEDLPPELVELFEQLGISLDDSGQPTPPPAPPTPTPPPEPLTPEDLAELLGIPVDQLIPSPNTTPPAAPAPAPPSPTADPLSPEELAEMLGLPVELFLPNPTPPAPLPAPEPAPPAPEPDPQTLEELAELLGLPVGVLTGETPPAPPVVPTPPTQITNELEFWQMLGFDEIPGQSVGSPAVTSAVPEPSSGLLLAIAAGLAPRRRR